MTNPSEGIGISSTLIKSTKKSKFASLFQHESLMMLWYSPNFRSDLLALYKNSKTDQERSEAIFNLLNKYNLADNLFFPIADYLQTLSLQDLLKTPDFFKIDEVSSRSGEGKHLLIEIYVEPTKDELRILESEIKNRFKNEGFHRKKKSLTELPRNLLLEMFDKRYQDFPNPTLKDINGLYEDDEDMVNVDRKRISTFKKAKSVIKKEFLARFGQPFNQET